MQQLEAFQRRFASALLSESSEGAGLSNAERFALSVHRNTCQQATLQSLRLTYPTIAKLTGEDYFHRVCRDYFAHDPPSDAVLYEYGQSFGPFLAACPGAEGYPYFSDVARFDWLIDRVSHQTPDIFELVEVSALGELHLSRSLTTARFTYAVNGIRTAVDNGIDQELASLDVSPGLHFYALWHGLDGVLVRALSPLAHSIIADLQLGRGLERALERAIERSPAAQVLEVAREEVLLAPFAFLTKVIQSLNCKGGINACN